MKIIKEFKEFANQGNVVDLAVGVIIGAAFGKIITSFVEDLLMPPIALLIGDVDFKTLKIVLKEAGEKSISINYGNFIQVSFQFLIIAFAIMMVIKLANRFKKEEAAIPAEPTLSEKLLTEIRDSLKSRG